MAFSDPLEIFLVWGPFRPVVRSDDLWRFARGDVLYLGKPSSKKKGKKRGHCLHVGGSTPVPFFSPNLPKFIGSSNHPEINSNTLEIQFLSHFFVIFRPFRSLLIQWVQGVWFLIILRAFYIKMSRVASRIYALLSVIRQQMSPFDPFRGGVCPKGTMSPFFTVFFHEGFPKWWFRPCKPKPKPRFIFLLL